MTKQEALGTIQGHDIQVKILGPEQQDIPDDAERIGSDVLMLKIERALAGVKQEVENGVPRGIIAIQDADDEQIAEIKRRMEELTNES